MYKKEIFENNKFNFQINGFDFTRILYNLSNRNFNVSFSSFHLYLMYIYCLFIKLFSSELSVQGESLIWYPKNTIFAFGSEYRNLSKFSIYNSRSSSDKDKLFISPESFFNLSMIYKIHRFSNNYTYLQSQIDNPDLKDILSKSRLYILYNYLYFLLFDEFFKRNNPSYIIMFDEYSPVPQTFLQVAKRHNIKVFAIQHGFISKDHYGYNFPKHLTTKKIYFPDYLFVYGDYYRDLLISMGWDASIIVSVGALRYLKYYSKNLVKKKHKLQPREIIWFTQSHGFSKLYNKKSINYINKLVEGREIILHIKPHPSEKNLKQYEKLTHRFPKKVNLLSAQISPFDIFKNYDFVITTHSTVAIEAILFDTPVIILNPDSTQVTYQHNIFFHVNNPNDFNIFLNQYSSFIKKFKLLREDFIKSRLNIYSTRSPLKNIKNFINRVMD